MIIWSIAKATVGDAMRKKVLQIFLVVTIGLIVISFSFSQTLSFSTREGASSDIMMIKSFGLGLMAVAGMFISLVMCVSLIPQEIERRTIYTILAKPVKRYEFMVGKFLGAILTLGINIGLMGLVFIIVVMIKAAGVQQGAAPAVSDISGVQPQPVGIFDLNTIWGVILIFLQFMVLSSVVLFFSVFLTPTVNFFMGAGVYIIGVMASVTEAFAKSESAGLAIRAFYTSLHALLPNFDRFNVPNALLHPEAHITNMARYTGLQFLYGLLYVFVMMLLAVVIFEKKEV